MALYSRRDPVRPQEDTTGFPFTGNAKFDPRNSPILTLGPLYGRWAQTQGKEGVEPPPAIKRIMEIVDQAKTVGTEQQAKLAQELFRIWVDNLWEIGTIGRTPIGAGRGRGQLEVPQRALDARQRLAAAQPRQRAPGAVLLRPLRRSRVLGRRLVERPRCLWYLVGMKSNTKSSITLPPEELRLVIALQARLKAKSKVDVVRRGLRLLQETTDRKRLREAYRRASLATRASLAKELEDLDPLVGEGLEGR